MCNRLWSSHLSPRGSSVTVMDDRWWWWQDRFIRHYRVCKPYSSTFHALPPHFRVTWYYSHHCWSQQMVGVVNAGPDGGVTGAPSPADSVQTSQAKYTLSPTGGHVAKRTRLSGHPGVCRADAPLRSCRCLWGRWSLCTNGGHHYFWRRCCFPGTFPWFLLETTDFLVSTDYIIQISNVLASKTGGKGTKWLFLYFSGDRPPKLGNVPWNLLSEVFL